MKQMISLLAICWLCTMLSAQDMTYQRPPQIIEDIALAPSSPRVTFNDTYTYFLKVQAAPYYSVEELAQPELKLAGSRINPNTYSISRMRGYSAITIVDMKNNSEKEVTGLPEDGIVLNLTWYPQGEDVLVAVKELDGVYLYKISCKDGKLIRISDRKVNATRDINVHWLNDTDFIVNVVPAGERVLPKEQKVPTGPYVEENIGKAVAARTYQDMLKNPYDEALYEYYFTSQLLLVNNEGETEIGEEVIYRSVSLSPNKSLLLVSVIEKPFSYSVPDNLFPSSTLVMDLQGNVVKELAKTPTVIPAMGYDTTSPYPRGFSWRPDKPASVYWVEAQDGGNPRLNKVEYLDIVYQQDAPFTDSQIEVTRTQMRYRLIQWCNDELALVTEQSRATRRSKTYRIKPCSNEQADLLFDLSTDDAYNDPGMPYMVKNSYGKYVLYTNKKQTSLFLLGDGASPEGEMPFLSTYDMQKKQSTILWRCKAPYYESVVRIIDPVKLQFITSRQSQTEPVNFFKKDLKKKTSIALTSFVNPYPMLNGVIKEKIRYRRADGVDLTATVYLPAGYSQERDGTLPVLMWAYPREYRSVNDAAQVRGSQYKFTTINYGSPVFWVTRGYCVMADVEMPIVGVEGQEPNDTFVEQVVMNAEAAVNVISEMGVGDRNRIAVGGHSYGAFMTANLLVHTNLFKAGIARSGAYNRTLTPFGFQAETRTYWEAPEVYNIMSPFMHADKLNGALLLVHGEMDNNSGTFPLQSERFYQALKGLKATVRYVVLPLESHGYTGKENILHLLYEQDAWLERFVNGTAIK